MRKPSPDDMIYAGLALRLGLVTDEELRGFSVNEGFKDKSFIEIMLARGVFTPKQHAGIQSLLGQMAQHPMFRERGLGGAALKGEIDQQGLPTVIASARPDMNFSPAIGAAPPPLPVAARPSPQPAAAFPQTHEMHEEPTRISAVSTAPDPLDTHARAMGPAEAPTLAAPLPGPVKFASPDAGTQFDTIIEGGPQTRGAASSILTSTDWTTQSSSVTREDIDRAARALERLKDNLIGKQMGGYVLLDKLGRGGMGDVYLAKQLALNRYVALKVLPRRMARDQDFVQRFLKEAQTLARINDSNVIQVYDVGSEGEFVYFTMELVKGRTLQDLIRENGTVPLELALNIIKQSCRALARVAGEGIIHRDIKPTNILLTDEGVVKVCDFGIAFQRMDQKALKEIAGTPFYIAPECLMGQPATSESDQYSLGVTFHHMLGGLPTTTPTSFFDGVQDLEPLSALNTAVPEEVSRIVERMTSANPGARFRKFAEIHREIETYELKKGLIKTSTEFLADRLVEMREVGLENFKQWAGAMTLAAVGFTGLAMFTHAILRKVAPAWIGITGGVGTILIFLSWFMILYVGAARKRMIPALGSLRQWVRSHYAIALTGYFLVMIHSGNFLASPSLKKALAWVPGLNARAWGEVPTVPFLASVALFIVIVSGLIGRYIFRDLHRQFALSQFGGREELTAEERQTLTRLVISARFMSYWRILHYPIVFFMVLLTILHVISTMFYGSPFFGVK